MKKRLYIPLFVIAGFGLILSGMMRGPVGEQRRLNHCQSNLKQIGLATMQYVRDYDERFPPSTHWQKDLEPYHRSPERMSCPNPLFSYSMNRYYSGLQLGMDNNVAKSPLYFDSMTQGKDIFDIGTSWPISGAHFHLKRPLSWEREGGSNVCYADGHVRWEQIKPYFHAIGPTFPPLPTQKNQKLNPKSGALKNRA